MFSKRKIALKSLLPLGIVIFSLNACDAKKNDQPQAIVSPPQDVASPNVSVEKKAQAENEKPSEQQILTSSEIVKLAWEASGQNNLTRLEELVRQCLEVSGQKAKEEQSMLTHFPVRGEESKYQDLNDVATCLFIKAESLMNSGKKDEAMLKFQEILDEYSWAQAWDPRGWYWSVAEKSQASMDVLTGKAQEELDKKTEDVIHSKPFLQTKGSEVVVDYSKYGKFENIGTNEYRYVIVDKKGLSAVLGEGIYPNEEDVYKNLQYNEVRKQGRLKGKHWDFINSSDLEAAYFKWVTAPEPKGVRLFYLGLIFERAEMYYEAIKAYQALVISFPNTIAWTYWQTPWYPGQAAIAKIKHIIQGHPELNLREDGMKIKVLNGSDNDTANDVFIVSPGSIVEKKSADVEIGVLNEQENKLLFSIKKKIGDGFVQLVQYENRHWQMLVNGEVYVIKGITYAPTTIGQSPDKGTLADWMVEDINKNGRPDGPYDSWVDKNLNNKHDPDEPVVGDFQLMKDMGVNTVRIYHHPRDLNKKILRDLFEKFGIRVIVGDYIGKYAIGSGATWAEGTDYENPKHQEAMLESIKKMVLEFKDEPYVLLWLLGNENNYGVASNADKKPDAYYAFVNKAAQLIKSLDKDHPVAIGNGDTLFLDIFAQKCPDVDIFGSNIYRGDYGFGSFWEQIYDSADKPAFITEYGSPAYAKHMTLDEADKSQADYHKGNWMDINGNLAGNPSGVGNALGGVAFEWLDEWWKNYEPFMHDRKSDAIGPFAGGFYYEEWFGINGQGNGSHSPFLRQPRKTYYLYKELWN